MHFRPRLLCEVVYAFRLGRLRVGGWWHWVGLRVDIRPYGFVWVDDACVWAADGVAFSMG